MDSRTASSKDALSQKQQESCGRGEVPSGYVVVEWPASQRYMDRENIILITGGPLYNRHGDAAYLVPQEAVETEDHVAVTSGDMAAM